MRLGPAPDDQSVQVLMCRRKESSRNKAPSYAAKFHSFSPWLSHPALKLAISWEGHSSQGNVGFLSTKMPEYGVKKGGPFSSREERSHPKMPTVRLLSYCPAVRRRGRFSWEPKKITDHCPSKRELSDRAGTGYRWGPWMR